MVNLNYFNRHVKLILNFYTQEKPTDPYTTVTYEHYIPFTNTKAFNSTRISFDIEKYPSNGLDCNGTAKIMIYNISDDVNDLLADEALIKEVELQVGYGKNTNTIYKGTINTTYVSYKNNDLITYMWCFSFASVLLGDKYAKPYPFKVPMTYESMLKEVLQDISKTIKSQMQVDKRYLDKKTRILYETGLFQNVTVIGLSGILQRISKDLSCDYYVEGNTVYLGSFREAKNRGLIKISPQNGLLDNPNVTDSGLELRMILNPAVEMFSPIEVIADYADYSGSGYDFTDVLKKINANYTDKQHKWKSFFSNSQALYVSHIGDTHTNTWETKVTTITLSEIINPKAVKAL